MLKNSIGDAMLKGKKIVLGICGSISAYKGILIGRELVKQGCELKIIVTESGLQFVTLMTLRSVVTKYVYENSLFLDQESHIELAKWADLFLIAPITANTIAKLAYGFSDCLISAMALSKNLDIMIAPAMNNDMWANAIVKHNMVLLKNRQFLIIEPVYGLQACGENGMGCLPEPNAIIDEVKKYFEK